MSIIEPVKTYSVISTDDPISETWNFLSIYENWESVKKTFKKRYPNEDFSKSKAEDISSLITQAKSFFLSAKTSSYSIKPLLIYYGVYCLSKAIILFKDTSKNGISDLFGHGVSSPPFKVKESIELTSVKLSKAKDIRGLFMNFNDCMSHEQTIYDVDTHKIIGYYNYAKSSDIENKTIKLKDIFQRIPDLINVYWKIYKEKPLCIRGNYLENNGKLQYEFINLGALSFSQEEITKYFNPVFKDCSFTKVNNKLSVICKKNRYIPKFTSNSSYNDYFIVPIKSKLFSEASLLLLGSYILSMVTRYDPQRWTKMISGKKKGEIFPLFTKFINVVEQKFPIIALNELSFCNHTFGTVGRKVYFEEIPES